MSIRPSQLILVAAMLLLTAPQAGAQFHYQPSNFGYSQNYNYSQYRSRSYQPIWTIYTPVSAIPCLNRAPRSFQRTPQWTPMNQPQAHALQPANQAIDMIQNYSRGIAPNLESMQPDSAMTASQNIIPGEIILDGAYSFKPSPDSSAPVTGDDRLSSPSDIILTDEQELALTDAEDQRGAANVDADKKMQRQMEQQVEIQRLQNEIAILNATNQKYSQESDDLRAELKQLRQAAKEKTIDKDLENRTAAEIKKIKQNSAWEVAKARKEAEKAKAALTKLKDKSSEKDKSDAKNKAKSKKRDGSKTLAEIAEEKREARQKKAKTKTTNDKKEPKSGRKSESSQSKKKSKATGDKVMNAQIKRAIGKIERRFDAKIERALKENESEESIGKLKQEMKIQMEKMEERIRSRFKNRKKSN